MRCQLYNNFNDISDEPNFKLSYHNFPDDFKWLLSIFFQILIVLFTWTMLMVLSSRQSRCDSSCDSSDECRTTPSGCRHSHQVNWFELWVSLKAAIICIHVIIFSYKIKQKSLWPRFELYWVLTGYRMWLCCSDVKWWVTTQLFSTFSWSCQRRRISEWCCAREVTPSLISQYHRCQLLTMMMMLMMTVLSARHQLRLQVLRLVFYLLAAHSPSIQSLPHGCLQKDWYVFHKITTLSVAQ